MEEAPVEEMSPELLDNGEPENRENNIHVFSKKGEYYLAYVAEKGQSIELNLEEDANYKVDLIDTWNMQIIPSEKKYAGKCVIEMPDKPYMAVRIIKQ